MPTEVYAPIDCFIRTAIWHVKLTQQLRALASSQTMDFIGYMK